jgi:Tol biopolymer transport system component
LAYSKVTFDVNIWKASSDAVRPVKLESSSRVDVDPALSHDGRRLAFVSDRDGSLALWISKPDGSDAEKIVTLPQGGSISWSPDDTRISYDARGDGRSHIYVVDPSTKHSLQLTKGERDDVVPSWSADGQWIYFSSIRSGKWNIWKLRSSGGDPVQVTRQGGVHGIASADGNFLYYAKPALQHMPGSVAELPEIWRIPASGGTEQLVLRRPGLHPVGLVGWYWTLAASGIYFVSSGNSFGATISRYDLRSHKITRVAILDKYPCCSPGLSVSRDGRTIFYGQIDVGAGDIVLVDNYR